jgi:hypothetical protein
MRKDRPLPLYEPNRIGPPITTEDFTKTVASMRAVLSMIAIDPALPEKDAKDAYKQISRRLSTEIGRPWSFLTAMQYLTGQRADKAVHRWADALEREGLSRPRVEALIATANDFCANGVTGKRLSAGLMVDEYARWPLPPEVFLELMALPPDVIDRVKARLAIQRD